MTSCSSRGRLHGSTTHIVGFFDGSWSSDTLSLARTITRRAARAVEPAGTLDRSTRMRLRWRMKTSCVAASPRFRARST